MAFSHLCIPVSNLDNSVAFYERWASLKLIERSTGPMGFSVARLADDDQGSFVLVLAEVPRKFDVRLEGRAHLGVSCASKEEVSNLANEAKALGVPLRGPSDSGPPLGYWAFIMDPDGHQLELSFGQTVGIAEVA